MSDFLSPGPLPVVQGAATEHPTTGRLPNLVIVGVPKAGTTSLFWYLSQHPDVCASLVKELTYFTPLRLPEGRLAPIGTYTGHFEHCAGQTYAMEASPSYVYGGGGIIEAIKRTLPGPRIIITLRDPVERLWSAYTFRKARGRLLGSDDGFDAFISECERQRQDLRRRPGSWHTALSVGFYGDYVTDWLDAFGDDALVVFAEHLFDDPKTTVAGILTWLGLDAHLAERLEFEPRNKTTQPRSERAGRLAYSVRGLSERLLKRQPALRAGIRKAYFRLNGRPLSQRMEAGTRARLEDLYRRSNATLAADLEARGYANLPAWLR